MQKIISFFRLIRLDNLLIIALSLFLFYYYILVPVHKNILFTTLLPFSTHEFWQFVLSVVLVAAAGNIINDYMDFELDRDYKPGRPLSTGAISLNNALYLHAVFAFAGIGLGFYLGYSVDNSKIGYVYVLTVVLLYAYSTYLKKIALAGNLVIAGLTGLVFVLPVIFDAAYLKMIHAPHLFENTGSAFNILLLQMKFYGGFAFLTNLAREIIKDIEDKDGDEAHDISTLAVTYGETIAKVVAALVLMVLLAALGYFINSFLGSKAWLEVLYLGLLLALPTFIALAFLIRAKTQKDYHILGNVLKFIMVLGVLSIAAFYHFSHLFAS